MNPIRLAIMISGRGSNMESIIRFVQSSQKQGQFNHVKIVLVLSDQKEAKGMEKAQKMGIDTHYIDPHPFKTKLVGGAEDDYIKCLEKKEVNLICLAGFMRVLKPKFINKFKNIINIHPSLLPAYPGLNTHERVLKDKKKETGCTLHWVDGGIDSGEIILQKKVRVRKNEGIQQLSRRVMEKEYAAYREVLEKIFTGKIELK